MNIGVVVLAAGEAKRMGMVKQILPIYEKPILNYIIDQLLDTHLHPLTVVVGANKEKVVPVLKDIPIGIIDNPDWKNGIGSSMRMGLIGSYIITKGIEGLIFIPSDMPHITSKGLLSLVKAAENSPDSNIIFSENDGFPILVKLPLFETLLELKDEDALRELLKIENRENHLYYNQTYNLNTPEDYLRFLESKN